eukprot:evm.model.scf_532.3 EVM.evm.TU.scf_532.3   scf_532:45785-52687(-)
MDQELFALASEPVNNETESRVEELLAHGASPNSCCDVFGQSVLHEAARHDNIVITAALLRAGALVDAQSWSGDVPLHTAAQEGSLRVLRLLLEAKANVNAKNSLGETPLHLASLFGHAEVVRLLLKFGADRTAVSDEGKTALDLACSGDCPDGADQIPGILESVPHEACYRHPYVVSLRDDLNRHMCMGILIAPTWVLTPAHCVGPDSFLGPTPRVVLGGCDLEDDPDDIEIVVPNSAIIFPDWDGSVFNGNDIALLELTEASRYQPAILPHFESNVTVHRHQNFVVLGFDVSGDGSVDLNQDLEAQTVANSLCGAPTAWGDSIIKDSMVCAFGLEDQQQRCGGRSSGAPLLAAFAPEGHLARGVPQADILIGISSFGDEESACGESNIPGVYTRISSFLEWIKQRVDSNGERSPEARERPSILDEELFIAATDGDLPAVRRLIAKGADVDITHTRLGNAPLHVAAWHGHTKVAEALIGAGANVDRESDRQGITPLIMASWRNHEGVAAALIAGGADVDKADDTQFTPLLQASHRKHLGIVLQLLKAGADIELGTTGGVTPLYLASVSGSVPIVRALLGAKADPNNGDFDEHTPLHAVARRLGVEFEEVASLLIAAGADVNARTINSAMETPLAAAAIYGNVGVAKVLLDSGADPKMKVHGGKKIAGLICICKERPKQTGRCAKGACGGKDAKALKKLLKKKR